MGDLRVFRAWLRDEQYSPRTERTYLVYVRRAYAATGGRLRGATVHELVEWVATLPPTATSKNQARKALAAFYRSIGRRPNPALELPIARPPRRLPRPLGERAHARFRAAARELGGMHEVVALLFATTGCRFTELRCARWADLELDESSSWWRIEGKGARRSGPRERIVPLHPAVVPVLAAWRAARHGTGWVFPSPADPLRPVSEAMLRREFAVICELAGLDGVVPHQLRHTVATMALEQSLDLRGVQELLGHASVATTQIYTRVLPSRLRDLVDALPA